MQVPWRKRVSRLIRARWRARVLSRHGVALVAETKNGTLAVDARDFNVSRHLLEHGEYVWHQITLLQSLVAPGARLVVVGAHGPRGVGRMLLGSVAEKVVRKAPCPVLTIHPKDHQFIMP